MGRSNDPEVHLGVPTEPAEDVRPIHPLIPRSDEARLGDDENENGHVWANVLVVRFEGW